MNYRQIVKNVPLFAGLSEPDIDDLMTIVRINDHPRGELLFSEGETAVGFFIVLDGKVKVYKLSAEGKERILHIIQPGGTFAEAAIFGEGLYPAYAETLQASKLLFLPKEAFLGLLRDNSRISINMIAGLSKFLRQFANQIEDLTFKDVRVRAAVAHAIQPNAAWYCWHASRRQAPVTRSMGARARPSTIEAAIMAPAVIWP